MTFDDGEHRIDYDSLVNWEKRLAREGPFFRKLFKEHDVKRVLDVACGTGRHAGLFSEWGLAVTAVDGSEEMIRAAKGQFGDRPIRFEVKDMREIGSLSGRKEFDACVCLGNGLPCLDSVDEMAQVVTGFYDMLRPGGLLVLHLLNFNRWTRERRIDGPRIGQDASRNVLFLKIFEPAGEKVGITILEMEKGETWNLRSQEGELLAIAPEHLSQLVAEAGFGITGRYADHAEAAFDAEESDNVILVSVRAT